MTINIEVLDSGQVGNRDLATRLRPLYRVAYADAPYHYNDEDADEFVERLRSQLERRGFRLLLATVGSEIAGFCYGYIFPQDMWWRGALTEPSPRLLTASKYAVVELVVDPAFQGRGHAHPLLKGLLAGRTEEVATLLAKPGALAHGMYKRWGWVKAGEVQSYPHWPVDDAFLLPLALRSLVGLTTRPPARQSIQAKTGVTR